MENRHTIIEEAVTKIFKSRCKNYIFVYTPPKVGSTTLVSSLRLSLNASCNVIHIHDDIMLGVLTGIKNVTVNEIIAYLADKGNNIYVIDVYRTPIERKMSEFFEKISIYHFNNLDKDISRYSVKRITDRFNKLFPYLARGEHYFDKFGLDNIVDFDFDSKYTLQTCNGIQYIKLRLKDVDSWAAILSTIFKKDIVIVNDYLTDDKPIADLYNRFKKEYKLPSNYYDLVQDCKYFKFYLADNERSDYLSRYAHRLGVNFVSYTQSEYDFYMNLCLENQFFDDIQTDHYLDEGCACNTCNIERAKLFGMLKKGIKTTKRIIHRECLNKQKDNTVHKLKMIQQQINQTGGLNMSSIIYKRG